jgi:hypothetical protein
MMHTSVQQLHIGVRFITKAAGVNAIPQTLNPHGVKISKKMTKIK